MPIGREEISMPAKGMDPALARRIVAEANKWIGTPYRYGGEKRGKGTDCSGMVMVIYRDIAGVKLPRSSREQQSFCKKIERKKLAPGDLVFFASKAGGARVGHVGIYRGKGEFVHASSSRGVIVSRLDEKYYQRHYHSGGRIPGIRERKLSAPLHNPASKKTPVVAPKTQSTPQESKETVSSPRNVPEVHLDSLENLFKTLETDSVLQPPDTKQTETADSIRASVVKAMSF